MRRYTESDFYTARHPPQEWTFEGYLEAMSHLALDNPRARYKWYSREEFEDFRRRCIAGEPEPEKDLERAKQMLTDLRFDLQRRDGTLN